jgi:hypothetical protein
MLIVMLVATLGGSDVSCDVGGGGGSKRKFRALI